MLLRLILRGGCGFFQFAGRIIVSDKTTEVCQAAIKEVRVRSMHLSGHAFVQSHTLKHLRDAWPPLAS